MKLLITTILITGFLNAVALETKINNESFSHKERISILEKAEECIKKAKNREEYKQCENIEKEDRKTFKKDFESLKLESKKSFFISRLDEKISKLQTKKQCIIDAESFIDMKKCKELNK